MTRTQKDRETKSSTVSAPKSAGNPKVDAFLVACKNWRAEFEALREIVLGCGLAEDLKWGWPCYTHDNRNVALIHGFKEYCAILFPKGALMRDADRLLIQQTENVQSARQIRFANVREIGKIESQLKAYIREAIEVERAGLKAPKKQTADFQVPEELQSRFDQSPAVKAAFSALTPGRQRAYILFFSAPKQAKTREARIEKSVPRILDGKGLDD